MRQRSFRREQIRRGNAFLTLIVALQVGMGMPKPITRPTGHLAPIVYAPRFFPECSVEDVEPVEVWRAPFSLRVFPKAFALRLFSHLISPSISSTPPLLIWN